MSSDDLRQINILAIFKLACKYILLCRQLYPFDDHKLNGSKMTTEWFLHEMYMYEWIQSIEFHESMIVICKGKRPKTPKTYCRVIVGDIEPITDLGQEKTWIPRYDKHCLSKH